MSGNEEGRPAPRAVPEGPADASSWDEALRRIRRREHALATLMELSRTFTVSNDLYEQLDTLLFGVMGQLGSSRSAVWVLSPELGTMPVLLRCHGFRRSLMQGFGSSLTPALVAQLDERAACLTDAELVEHLDDPGRLLTAENGIAAIAVIPSTRGPLGVVTIGRPLDRERFYAGDLQILETAAGLIGMAIVNARLHGELAESNRVLKQANEALEELDRVKSEFIANVNHELRTPLTVIQAGLELIRDRVGASGDVAQMLAMASNATDRLQGLVEKLLAFSALRRDPEPLRSEPINIASLLAEFQQARVPGVNAGFRELALRCENGLPPAFADARSLLMILEESVSNAVKFTPRGTRIELSAELDSIDDRTAVVIRVRDNGPGLAENRLDTIFREFEHGGASQASRPGGIGLGLPLAHRLARSMGGSLELDSKAGSGVCVTIWLRAAERRRGTDAGGERAAA